MKNPIFIALDVNTKEEALRLAEDTSEYVGGFKLGPRLLLKTGLEFVEEISKFGDVFVDCKFHDIPSTVIANLQSVFESGAKYATIHASCGRKTLNEVSQWEKKVNEVSFFRVLCVTVLTSFSEKDLPCFWKEKPISHHVLDLSEEVLSEGLQGLVCSPQEVEVLREKYPESFLVTPGVRLEEEQKGDQKRTSTPKESLEKGATLLVVGRPIVKDKNPETKAKKYFDSIKDLL